MSQPALAPPPSSAGQLCSDCGRLPATRTVSFEMAVGEQPQGELIHMHFCVRCFARWAHEQMP